ncbi:hypothetical protein CspeluHIS016_0802490 [Cutaneotrichosporon spelunceum]|uniref:Uncharacterized protein n=1 Tax=Cutaneotrichosporon spelunceum TaxID=1672016 RepID=A0AAD3TZJ3_9TREE|nr:hypothetical protein CspeluHIS016_0802490 [Cutaneotrichosporon spelunceum]
MQPQAPSAPQAALSAIAQCKYQHAAGQVERPLREVREGVSALHITTDKLPGDIEPWRAPRRPSLPSGASLRTPAPAYRRPQAAHGMVDLASPAALTAHFRAYIRQLNQHLPSTLRLYLAPRIVHNGRRISAEAFAAQVCPPGATVSSEMIVADIAKRLLAARVLVEVPHTNPGPVSDAAVPDSSNAQALRRGSGSSFQHVCEHVFYHFDESWCIDEVWSVTEPRSDSPRLRGDKGREHRRRSVPPAFDDYRF